MRLSGQRNQCPTCDAYFASNAAFDAHRTGKWHERRCKSTDELTDAGWTNGDGFWRQKGPEKSPWRKEET